MNTIRRTLISLWLLPTLACGHAQTAGKPVLSAAPVSDSAPSMPASAPAPGPDDNSKYIIGDEDQLKIEVWKEQQLSTTLPVRPDGKISLPLINDIQAAGLTPMQLQVDITERLKKFITDPVVDVSVLAVNSKHIYLMGEVNHVGSIPIVPGMNILQALATAGGLTPYANKKKIYILRGDPARQQKISFDYNKARKGDMQGIVLQPGDTIFVP